MTAAAQRVLNARRVTASSPSLKGHTHDPGTPADSATKQVRSFTAMLAAATDVIVEQIPLWRDIASVARRMPILRQSDLIYSFYDHSPSYYVSASQPPGVVSELGDF